MSLEWINVDSSGNVSTTTLNVDGGTLFVDKENDRVGVGNTTPQTSFHVGESRTLTGTYTRNGTTIKVTTSSVHNFVSKNPVKLFFSSGDAIDGNYIINDVEKVNTFSCIASEPSTGNSSGNVTVRSLVYFIEEASYTGKNTILTVVFPGHGFRVGDFVTLYINTGSAISDSYQVSGVSGDGELFTVNHPVFSAETSGILRLEAPLSSTPKESVNGAIIYNNVCADPKPDGTSNFTGTLWVNSTSDYARNCGASVALGGLNYFNSHMAFAKVSGVQTKTSDLIRGDFVVETMFEDLTDSTVKMYERLRITSDGKVGLGTDAPQTALDLGGGDLLTEGIVNSGFDISESDTWNTPGSYDASTHISSLNASTILDVPPAKHSETGFNVRLVSADIAYAVFANNVVTNFDNTDVYSFVSGRIEGDKNLNYVPDRSPVGSKADFPNPASGGFSNYTGFLSKIKEDGTPIWTVYQDSPVDDSNTSACILNRGPSPLIVTGGFVTTAVTPTISIYNKTSVVFTKTLGGKGYYIVVYDNSGQPLDVASIYGTGAVTDDLSMVVTSEDVDSNYSFYAVCYTDTNSSGNITIDPTVHSSSPTTFSTGSNDDVLVLVKFSVNSSTGHISLDWYSYIKTIASADITLYDGSFNYARVDSENNLYVTARYGGSPVFFYNQSPGASVAQITLEGGTGAFLAKYNESGVFQWVSKIDGPSDEFPTSLAIDSLNNVYMAGMYQNQGPLQGIEFYNYVDPTNQSLQLTLNPTTVDFASFVCKYNPSGQFQWGTVIEGEGGGADINPNREESVSIVVDQDDNITVAVIARSNTMVVYNQQNSNLSTPIAPFRQTIFSSNTGTLLVKYTSDGKGLFLHRSEGNGTLNMGSLSVSQKNQMFAVGSTTSSSYRVENPDGSSFTSIVDKNNSTGTATDSFVMKLPFYPTFILRDPVLDQSYRKRLVNTSPIEAYVTFFDGVNDTTYDFTYVPFVSALDLQYTSRWIRVTNVFRGTLTVDDTSGYVGIGTQNPTSKFEVVGDMKVVGDLTVTADMYARNYIVTSDKRLKKDIKPVDGSHAVDVISSLQPVEYSFIDSPNRRVFGFIAQDVEENLDIVKRKRGFIPDVYTFCPFERDQGLMWVPKSKTGKLRIMTDGGHLDIDVEYADETHVYYQKPVLKYLSSDSVFVYGYETDDLRTVDMQSLFSLNVAATKEILKRIRELERGSLELNHILVKTLQELNP